MDLSIDNIEKQLLDLSGDYGYDEYQDEETITHDDMDETVENETGSVFKLLEKRTENARLSTLIDTPLRQIKSIKQKAVKENGVTKSDSKTASKKKTTKITVNKASAKTKQHNKSQEIDEHTNNYKHKRITLDNEGDGEEEMEDRSRGKKRKTGKVDQQKSFGTTSKDGFGGYKIPKIADATEKRKTSIGKKGEIKITVSNKKSSASSYDAVSNDEDEKDDPDEGEEEPSSSSLSSTTTPTKGEYEEDKKDLRNIVDKKRVTDDVPYSDRPVCEKMNVTEAISKDAEYTSKYWHAARGKLIYVSGSITCAPVFSTVLNTSYIMHGYRSNDYTKWIEGISSGYKKFRRDIDAMDNSKKPPPGSAILHEASTADDYDVITIFSRLREGASSEGPEDSLDVRRTWFAKGLRDVLCKYKDNTVLAVPYCIGVSECVASRRRRQALWKPFLQTLTDFAMMNDVCILVFLGTPEGATASLQQELEGKDEYYLKTELVTNQLEIDRQTSKSENKLFYEGLSKGMIRRMVRRRVATWINKFPC